MQPEETRRRSLTRCLSEANKITEIQPSENATKGVCQSGAIKLALTVGGRSPVNAAAMDPERFKPAARHRWVDTPGLSKCVHCLTAVGAARELRTPVLRFAVSPFSSRVARFWPQPTPQLLCWLGLSRRIFGGGSEFNGKKTAGNQVASRTLAGCQPGRVSSKFFRPLRRFALTQSAQENLPEASIRSVSVNDCDIGPRRSD